jgi:MFS family permease
MENKLKLNKTFLLGMGFFMIVAYETLYDNVVPLMLRHYIEQKSVRGFIMTLDNYIALFMVPLIGFYSDKINTKFGKRMPFIMVGMPLAATFILLLPNYETFMVFHGLAYLVILIVLTNISMSIYRSPVIALMPDITHREHRGKANSIVNFVGGFGAVFATLFGMMLFEKNETYPFYILSVLMIVAFLIIYIAIKENRDVLAYEKQDEDEISIFKNISVAFSRKEVAFTLFAVCFWFIAYNGIKTFFSTYGVEYLGVSESETGEMLTFMSLPFLLFALPAGLIGMKIGKKKAMTVGLIGVLISMVFFIFFTDLTVIKASFVLLGTSWSLVNINAFPFVANLAPNGKIGIFTGLYYLFSTVANIISPVLLGLIIDLAGWGSMFIYSSIFFGLALIFISMVKNSDNI